MIMPKTHKKYVYLYDTRQIWSNKTFMHLLWLILGAPILGSTNMHQEVVLFQQEQIPKNVNHFSPLLCDVICDVTEHTLGQKQQFLSPHVKS